MATWSLHSLPKPPTPSRGSTYNVAVIGAGAAGLVAARYLRRDGHEVVVFERQDKVGGTWVYNPNVESDPIGLDPSRTIIHTSLYQSLRIILPREVTGLREFPFTVRKDPRRCPAHHEVLLYLNDFASEFGLLELVRFETEVSYVGLVEEGKWKVKSRGRDGGIDRDEIFDAVVVCNRHYTEPRLAEIPGIDTWPGKQMHSHNYRVHEPFQDQVVVIVGSSISAVDISRDIVTVAKGVHIASRSSANQAYGKQPGYDNLWLHPMIDCVHEDGNVVFQDGSLILADVILYCTGYKYHFPFLETNGIVTVVDNRVGPLYKHIFPPLLAPWLSFVGLPWKVAPLPMFEYQSKWIVGCLSGRIGLPSQEEMMDDVKAFYASLETSGIPKHYTHNMGDHLFQYNDWLAAQCGCAVSEEWRKQMYDAASKSRRARPETYRDEWEDDHLIIQAEEDFSKYS